MSDLPAIASIFGLAFFYFWPAIPAGLALGLSPLIVIATTSLSYMSGSAGRLQATPHSTEPTRNSAIPARITGLRPTTSASLP